MYEQEPVRVNLRGLVIVMVLFGVGMAWFLGALANEDPLWFLPYFNETPARITLYRDGCRVEIYSGENGFEDLTVALNQALSQVDGYEQGFGLSPETYKQYTTQWRAVEVLYPKRVKIHVAFRFGDPDTLFIPLNEYFANSRAVFGSVAGKYWAGALRLKTIEPIQRAAEQIRCIKR